MDGLEIRSIINTILEVSIEQRQVVLDRASKLIHEKFSGHEVAQIIPLLLKMNEKQWKILTAIFLTKIKQDKLRGYEVEIIIEAVLQINGNQWEQVKKSDESLISNQMEKFQQEDRQRCM